MQPEPKPEPEHDSRGTVRGRMLMFLAVALSPILIFAIVDFYFDARAERDLRRADLLSYTDRAIDRIEKTLATAEALLIIETPDIIGGQCADLFERTQPVLPALSNVIATDTAGIVRCAARGETGRALDNLAWLTEIEAGAPLVRTEAFYGSLSNDWLFAVLARAENAEGEFVGVSGFGIRIESLTEVVRDELAQRDSISLGPDGVDVGLVSPDGSVFGSDRFERIPKGWRFSEDDASDLFTRTLDTGEKVDVVVRPVGTEGLYAVLTQPAATTLSGSRLAVLSSLIVPVLAFLGVIAAAWVVLDRLILRWLMQLERVARVFGAGKYTFKTDRSFADAPLEISQLAETLDTMADQIGQRDIALKKAITVRDAAVKEIHHRVKNNLQIVTSFLSLQSRKVEDPAAKSAIAAARHRIDALAQVHQTLYQNDDLERVHLRPFLSGLLRHLEHALGISDDNVTLDSEVEDVALDADRAVPLGLFLVEAITNSLKYAFDGDAGTISVKLRERDGEIEMIVEDDGCGRAEVERNGTGLGHHLMAGFVRQMQGELDIRTAPDEGYALHLTLPLIPTLADTAQ